MDDVPDVFSNFAIRMTKEIELLKLKQYTTHSEEDTDMVTKEILIQYSDLQEEIKEVRDRIEKTENQIERIEREGAVCDKVMGGDGGLQPFKNRRFPISRVQQKKDASLCEKSNTDRVRDGTPRNIKPSRRIYSECNRQQNEKNNYSSVY